MPSNADLRKQISESAELVGLEQPETEGLKNDELAALLSDIKNTDTAPVRTGYFVMKGKAIITKRGVLSDGDSITASDLPGGTDVLEQFVKSGHIGRV